MTKLIHEEIRREMDNYLNHAKANGFKTDNYASLDAYCHLLHEIIVIHDFNVTIEQKKKEDKKEFK